MIKVTREISLGSILQLAGFIAAGLVFIATMRGDLSGIARQVKGLDDRVQTLTLRLDRHIDETPLLTKH